MLVQLRIRNLAVLESAEICFGPGLNALTGETGAGKSVLLGALGLALGGRGDPQLIRTGCDRATVAAVFTGVAADVLAQLDSLGVAGDEELVLTRELTATGRSTARIGSAVVPVATLREFGERLLEVHGQGSTSRWLHETGQRAAVDGYGGSELRVAHAEVGRKWLQRERLLAQLTALRLRSSAEATELEQAVEDLRELQAAGLRAGEEVELRRDRERLRHAARLRGAAQQLHQACGGEGSDSAGSAHALAAAVQACRQVRGIDAVLDEAADQAEGAVLVLRDLELQMGSYVDGLVDDGARLAEIEERLDFLERLARRHGGSVDAAIARRDEAANVVGSSGGLDRELRRLEAAVAEISCQLGADCQVLTEQRRVSAGRLQQDVTEDLRAMLMPSAEFQIRLSRTEDPDGVPDPRGVRFRCSEEGCDQIAFELAANAGDSPRPLAEVASGGELARAALALLARLSHQSAVGSVVFDEIDQGLGGEAANRVGELLRTVSRSRQVICVTHLAPIAARADHHFRVSKIEEPERAYSQVVGLDGSARVDELARLLAGNATPRAGRSHALELLASVRRA